MLFCNEIMCLVHSINVFRVFIHCIHFKWCEGSLGNIPRGHFLGRDSVKSLTNTNANLQFYPPSFPVEQLPSIWFNVRFRETYLGKYIYSRFSGNVWIRTRDNARLMMLYYFDECISNRTSTFSRPFRRDDVSMVPHNFDNKRLIFSYRMYPKNA